MALMPTAALGSRTDILAAEIPAGAATSARAIARMYAALLGEVDGVRLLGPQRLREATAPAATGIDAVFGNPATWALGYAVGLPGGDPRDSPTVFGMGGAGGSFTYGDTATGVAFALPKNVLSPDFRTAETCIGMVRDATRD
ncbi:serine hydrolase [Streptomyces sp. A5-4]|uniref:serine hydrolase n=1 Tax=Streptomyces sp. A5-4 TaxID=3384771 RepID=UPI003DA92DE0